MSNEAMVDYGVIIFALWELLSRTKLDQIVSPSYNVLVSNVPGPGDEALYLCGSLMLSSFPISTLLPGVNLNTTLLSHGNKLDFGLLGDMHALPDLDIVAQQMVLRFDELQLQVLGKARAPKGKKSTATKKTKAASSTRKRSATRAKARPRRTAG